MPGRSLDRRYSISAGPFHSGNAGNVAGTTVLSATIGTAFRPEACPFLLSPNCEQQDMLLIGVDAPHTRSHTRTPNGRDGKDYRT